MSAPLSHRRTLTLLTSSHMFIHIYSRIHLALIPVFMIEFDASLFQTSLMVAIPLLCQATASVLSGQLTDRFGATRIIILSLVLILAGAFLAYGAVEIRTLVFSFSVLLIAITLFHPPSLSIVSELYPRHRSAALGTLGSSGTLGIALGPLSVGLLMPILGWRIPYLIWSIPILFYIPIFAKQRFSADAFHRSEVQTTRQSATRILTRIFLLLMILVSVTGMARSVISTYLSTYLVLERSVSAPLAAIVLGLFSLIGVGSGPSGGFIADRFGERRWLTVTYIAAILSLLGVIYASLFTTLLVALLIYGFFIGTELTITTSLAARFTPKERRGMAYGIFLMPAYTSGALAPILASYIAERTSISSIFPLGIVLIAISLVMLMGLPQDMQRRLTHRA